MDWSELGAQKEYVQARQLGYGFTNHSAWWHWMYPLEMINPEDRAKLEKKFPGVEYFIWSARTYGSGRVVITPINKGELLNWTQKARAVAAQQEEKK